MVDADKLLETSRLLKESAEKFIENKEQNKDALRKLQFKHYQAHVHNNKKDHDKIVKKILALNGHHDCFATIDRGCEEW